MRWAWSIVVVLACAARTAPPLDPRATVAEDTAEDPPVGRLAGSLPTTVLVPQPPFDPSEYLPDFHDELRWPLGSMSHPALEPHFAIAQALADPGIGWIELCGIGAQNRHGGNKDLLAYLRGWCSAIKGDIDAACTNLVPLIGSTTRGLDDAVKVDLANILATEDAERAEHWLHRHRIHDIEILDLLAANYVEVGTVADAVTINRMAMDADDRASVVTRCTRLTRQIALVGNRDTILIEALKQIASSIGKVPDPTCAKLLHKLECWRASGTIACEPYWQDVGISSQAAVMLELAAKWRSARTFGDWWELANRAANIEPFPGAAAIGRGATHTAVRPAGFCSLNTTSWLASHEASFRIAGSPDIAAQYRRLVEMCGPPPPPQPPPPPPGA